VLGFPEEPGLALDHELPGVLGHAWTECITPFPVASSTAKNASTGAIKTSLFIKLSINDIIFKSYWNNILQPLSPCWVYSQTLNHGSLTILIYLALRSYIKEPGLDLAI
jgi:hypothetical protein